MTVTASRSVLVLALIFGVWWLTRSHEPPADPDVSQAAVEAGVDRVMQGKLELAVTSAANAAECGYTEVGYGYREPSEAPSHLVALMRSAMGPAPDVTSAGEPMVDYVLDRPQEPWQVAVRLDQDGPTLVIEGYGPDLEEPLFSRRVPCS